MRRVHIVSSAAAVALGLIVLAGFVPSVSIFHLGETGLRASPDGGEVDWGGTLRKPRGAKYVARGIGAPGGHDGSSGGAEKGGADAKGAKRARALAPGRVPRAGDHLGEAMRREWDGEAGAWVATNGGFDIAARDPRGAKALAPPRERGPSEDDRDEPPPERAEEPVFSVPLDREHGTLASDSTPPLVEQNLSFPEEGDGVRFGDDSVLAFPNSGNLRGEAGTLSVDVEPEWDGEDEGDHSLLTVRTPNDPSNVLRVYKNGRYLRYLFSPDTGFEHDISLDIGDWESGEQHNVSVTWDGSAIALYVDRRLVRQEPYGGRLQIPPGTPLYVGSDIVGAVPTGARGVISDVRVFGRALAPDDFASAR